MPSSVDIIQGLSPVTLSLLNGLEKIVAIVSGMEVMGGLSSMVFYLWGLICQPANSRGQLWAPDMVSFPKGWDSHVAAGWLLWPTSILEEAVLCSHWKRYPRCGLVFLALSAFAKPPSVDLHNMICSKVFPQHCSWPRNSFKSSWSAAMDYSCWWNSLIILCSPSPWSPWPDRKLEKPFEDLVFMASGSNTLQGYGKALQDVVYALSWWLMYGAISCITRIHRSRKTMWKWEWFLSLLPIVSHYLLKFGVGYLSLSEFRCLVTNLLVHLVLSRQKPSPQLL